MLALLWLHALADSTPQVTLRSRDGDLFANGQKFRIKGVTWGGAETPLGVPSGLLGPHAQSIDHYFEKLSQSGFNAIRLTFSHRAVLDAAVVTNFDEAVEPGLKNKRYVSALHFVALKAAQRGILVLLACARLEPDDPLGNGLWYSAALPEKLSMFSWASLAHVLCDQWNVFGVDLFDSPRGAVWGGRLPVLDWYAASTRLAAAVHRSCPRWMVMVQGARSGDWTVPGPLAEVNPSENLMGLHAKRISVEEQSKLVYLPCLAPPSEHFLPAYRMKTFPTNMATIWSKHFGFAAEQSGQALVVGRVGGLLSEALDARWQQAALEWISSRKFGFFYDCMVGCADVGGLFHKDGKEMRAEKMKLLDQMEGTALRSLPQEHGPLRGGSAGDIPPAPLVRPPPEADTRFCVRSLHATLLSGALDSGVHVQQSTPYLALYAGMNWQLRLKLLTLRRDEVSLVTSEAGVETLEVFLNRTTCFMAPFEMPLCLAFGAITARGHVRHENRGCGRLDPHVSKHTFELNDQAEVRIYTDVVNLAEDVEIGDAFEQVHDAFPPVLAVVTSLLLLMYVVFVALSGLVTSSTAASSRSRKTSRFGTPVRTRPEADSPTEELLVKEPGEESDETAEMAVAAANAGAADNGAELAAAEAGRAEDKGGRRKNAKQQGGAGAAEAKRKGEVKRPSGKRAAKTGDEVAVRAPPVEHLSQEVQALAEVGAILGGLGESLAKAFPEKLSTEVAAAPKPRGSPMARTREDALTCLQGCDAHYSESPGRGPGAQLPQRYASANFRKTDIDDKASTLD